MEQLTEFVSKSFTADRMSLLSTSASSPTIGSVTSAVANRSVTPSVASSMLAASNLVNSLANSNLSFSSLPLFRQSHSGNPFPSAAALHSVVDRLGGLPSIPGLQFFNPAFHGNPNAMHGTTATSHHHPLSLAMHRERFHSTLESPPLSPGKQEVVGRANSPDMDSSSIDPDATSLKDSDDENNTRDSTGKNFKPC